MEERMETKGHTTYDEMESLYHKSGVVRSAHFIAAQDNKRYQTITGLSIVLLNVLIGSGLIELAWSPAAPVVIKLLSFGAAALAAVQTFFNFQKDKECHLKGGAIYGEIHNDMGMIISRYNDDQQNRDAVITDFKALFATYEKANNDLNDCIPSDKDYRRARESIKQLEGAQD
jgi:hypothetical protein